MAVRDSVPWSQSREARGIGCFLAVAMIVGFQWFITAPAIRHIWVGGAAESWPSVEGSIRQIEQVKRGRKRGYSFTIEFLVGGSPFTCTTYGAGGWGVAPGTEQWRAAKPGDVVCVYYDPTRPESSCISPGVKSKAWLWVFGGLLPILMLLIGLIRSGWRLF